MWLVLLVAAPPRVRLLFLRVVVLSSSDSSLSLIGGVSPVSSDVTTTGVIERADVLFSKQVEEWLVLFDVNVMAVNVVVAVPVVLPMDNNFGPILAFVFEPMIWLDILSKTAFSRFLFLCVVFAVV